MSEDEIKEEFEDGGSSEDKEPPKESPRSPRSKEVKEEDTTKKGKKKGKAKKPTSVDDVPKTIRRSKSCENRKTLKLKAKSESDEGQKIRSVSPDVSRKKNTKGRKNTKVHIRLKARSGSPIVNELSIREALKENVISEDEESSSDPRSPRSIKLKDSTKNENEKRDERRVRTAPSSSRSTNNGGDNGLQTGRSRRGSQTIVPSPRNRESKDGRNKQKEFFKEELKRLKTGLRREADKIMAPPLKPHIPYVFNTLEPYYDVRSARFLIELPEPARSGYVSRQTAIGLCDPWDNHRMDEQFMLPPMDPKQVASPEPNKTPRLNRKQGRPTKRTPGQKERPPKEGSTRLPKFPAVRVPTDELNNENLYYDKVPMLRTELRKKYSSCATDKMKEDYKRTKQDFFRMELDRMEAYHPNNRPHMRSAYFAYLQNTPGSRQAVYECVGSFEKGNQNNQQQNIHRGQPDENVAS